MWTAIRRRALLSMASIVIRAADAEAPIAADEDEELREFLDGDAVEVAEGLRRFLTRRPSELDREVAEALAFLHWYRYWMLDDTGEDELGYAISLFQRLYAVDPDAVPAILAPLFDPDRPAPEQDEEDLDLLVACATGLFSLADAAERSDPSAPAHRDQATALARRALAIGRRLDHLDPGVRAELATMLLAAYEYTRDDELLDAALAGARAALAGTPPGQPEWLGRVVVLGRVLLEAADSRSDGRAVREMLDVLRPAIHAAAPDDPQRTVVAILAASAVSLRLAQNWNAPVLVDTAAELRRLLAVIPEDVPERDAFAGLALVADANHLIGRGDVGGMLALLPALDEVIDRARPGTAHHDRIRLTRAHLPVIAHITRHQPAPEPDLSRYRETVAGATALDPMERATHLDALGTALGAQAELTGDRDILDDCVRLLTDGLSTVPEDSAAYRALGATLGSALLIRFREAGNDTDLDRAISLLRNQLPDLADNTWEQSAAWSELGHALREHYLSTGADSSYQEALGFLRASASSVDGVLVTRLFDAWTAGQLAATAGRWDEAADILAEEVALAPQLAWRGMSRADQQENLAAQLSWREQIRRPDVGPGTLSGSAVVNEATAAAVRAGRDTRAVELLDEGRTVLLHQALDSRGGVAGVRAGLPELAARLDEIQRQLDTTGDPRRRHDLAREWDRLVDEVRSRPGFDRFLRGPTFAALRPATGQTVVLVNPADIGSDAFLVTASGVRVVALPALRTADIRDRVAGFHRALGDRAAAEVVNDTLDWLWRTTAEPILAALGHGGTPAPDAPWPRVHWCPTSMLSFLPLHAAAAAGQDQPGQSVLDRVVSSYTPSLRMLRYTSQRPDPPSDRRRLLVVAMPETPGLGPLPGARLEASILDVLPVPSQVLAGAQATHDAVLRAIDDHAWVHFACHATQDRQDPSRGRLFLYDHPLTVLEISRLRLEYAQFAFLSACDTARGGLRLPDEALHLGGALQLAGYQHVIATLWPINDRIAAVVAGRVYDRLRTGEVLAPARAAAALHTTVRALRRRYPNDPTLWASYVHFGP